jgi:hypothetical protein
VQALGKAWYFFRQLARRMTAMLLFWQGTVRLDYTYAKWIVKHDAGTLGVSWLTNGALNLLRSPEVRREPLTAARFHRACSAAGREADDFGGSSALNPTNLSFSIH